LRPEWLPASSRRTRRPLDRPPAAPRQIRLRHDFAQGSADAVFLARGNHEEIVALCANVEHAAKDILLCRATLNDDIHRVLEVRHIPALI